MSAVNYRFYILNQHEHIVGVDVVECCELQDIEHTAQALLAKHLASAAIEVWDRAHVVYRAERSEVAS